MRTRVVLLALVVVCLSVAASPAHAQVTPGSGNLNSGTTLVAGEVGSSSGNGPGVATFDNTVPNTSTITAASGRTVIDMNGFNLPNGQTLNVVMGSSSDIVVIRVNAGAATVAGTLNSYVGSVGGAAGGNVLILAPGGVTLDGSSVVDVGGLIAATALVSDADLLGPDLDFAGFSATNSISVASGADIAGHDGVVGFVAPTVQHAGNVATGGDADVLYGSATDFDLGFATDASGGFDLLRFAPSPGSLPPAGAIDLTGQTTADNIFVAAAGGPAAGASIVADNLNATGAVASGNGDVVLSAGGGLTRPTSSQPLAPVQPIAAGARDIVLDRASALGAVRARATGSLTLMPLNAPAPTGALSAQEVALSTGGTFNNAQGASAIAAPDWVVKAPTPAGHGYGGLDSGTTADWSTDLNDVNPASGSGHRYAFAETPVLTFTSLDLTKTYGEDASADLDHQVSGYRAGVTGAFVGDDAASAFTGEPALSSDGTGPLATVVEQPYGIDIALGTLASPSGYAFAFQDDGVLTVEPSELNDPTQTFTQPGANTSGWHNSTASQHAEANDDTGMYSLDCTLNGADATLANAGSTFTQRSGDITTSDEGRHDIACHALDVNNNDSDGGATLKIDKSAPNPPTVTADRAPEYAGDGGWFKDTVTLSFAAAGDPDLADGSAGSGVDAATLPSAQTFSASGVHSASGPVSDNAGNASTDGSGSAQVDADPPSLSISCPSEVIVNEPAQATMSASDDESGLDGGASDTDVIDTSHAGTRTVTKTVVDNVGHSTTDTCTTRVVYRFGGFRQPINPDGSSVFKLGSTVPVKLVLTDYFGVPVSGAEATLQRSKLTGAVEGSFDEAVSTSAATTGSQFRYEEGQYVFNLGTKSLSRGTWRLRASLDDGTTRTVDIGLR